MLAQNTKRKLTDKKPLPEENPEKKGRERKDFSKLLEAVQNQGPLGQLVITHNENESPFVILQNSLSSINFNLVVTRDDTNM